MFTQLTLLCVIAAAAYAVESRNTAKSIMSFAVMGAFICISFLLMGHIEASFLQLLFEVCMITVLVIFVGREISTERYDLRDIMALITGISFSAVMLFASYKAFRFIKPNHLELGNRPFDTLIAGAAIFAAMIAVLTILRNNNAKH